MENDSNRYFEHDPRFKDIWLLDYGRGFSLADPDENNSNKSLDFWFEYNMSCYVPITFHRNKVGHCDLSVSCGSDFFALPEKARLELKEVFDKHKTKITLYHEVCVLNVRPVWDFTRWQIEALYEIELNEAEQDRVIRLLHQFTRIYLIMDSRTQLIKIGRSNNPEYRLQKLIKQDTLLPQPNDFTLIHWWHDLPQKETELHNQFKDKRVRGEWFSLTEEDVKSIIDLNPYL